MGVVMLSVLFISGCNGKKPSKSTFEKTLQDHFNGNQIYIGLSLKLPVKRYDANASNDIKTSFQRTGGIILGGIGDIRAELDVLTSLGLLTAEQGVEQVRMYYGNFDTQGTDQTVNTITYSESSTGSKFIRGGKESRLSYAHLRVISVDNYTEPTNLNGQIISEVSYTYVLEPIASWVKNPALLRLMPELNDLGTHHQDKGTLALYRKGWTVIDTGIEKNEPYFGKNSGLK